jgi:hypothetical protein
MAEWQVRPRAFAPQGGQMNDAHCCPHHPEERQTYCCATCGRPFCERCQEGINAGDPRCPNCFAAEAPLLADAADWTDWPDLL